MSFASTIKTLKKEIKISHEKKTKGSDEVKRTDVETSYSKDSIEYIDKYLENAISQFDYEQVKAIPEFDDYITKTLKLYEKNEGESNELNRLNINQKSGLVINTTNVKRYVTLPENKKKISKEELLKVSAFSEKLLKEMLDEASRITVNEFNKHTVNSNHVKLAIINKPLLLKYFK